MPPVTLTRQQFAQTKTAAKPGATYERYLSYVNNARSKPAVGAADPLAPAAAPDFSTLLAQARQAVGQQPTDQQIADRARTAVAGAIGPVTTGITNLYGDRGSTVSHAITGYTDAATSALDRVPKPDYNQTIQQRAAANAALTGFLGTEGQQAADALHGKLAAINAPDASLALGNTATAGVAGQSARDLLARGTAGIDRLASDKTAAQAYAESLPSIVQLAGMQNQRLAGAQNQAQLATALADVNNKAPELTLGLEQNLTSARDANRRSALGVATSMLNTYNSNELKKAITAAGIGVDLTKLDATAAKASADRNSREAIARANRDAAAARQTARDNSALDRARLQANAAASKHLDSLTTSAFQKAAAAASRMKVGTYGSSSGSSTAQVLQAAGLGAGGVSTGTPYPFQKAYNAVYGVLEGILGRDVKPQGIRRLTLRALAAGGYPVQVTKGG